MFFNFGMGNKTVKELRKNQNLTAKALAEELKIDIIDIMKIDNMHYKDVYEPLKSKLHPILSGEYMDKIPW